jgi:hypothetical protein
LQRSIYLQLRYCDYHVFADKQKPFIGSLRLALLALPVPVPVPVPGVGAWRSVSS